MADPHLQAALLLDSGAADLDVAQLRDETTTDFPSSYCGPLIRYFVVLPSHGPPPLAAHWQSPAFHGIPWLPSRRHPPVNSKRQAGRTKAHCPEASQTVLSRHPESPGKRGWRDAGWPPPRLLSRSCRNPLMPAAFGSLDETGLTGNDGRKGQIKANPAERVGRSHHANRHDFAEPTILRLTIICMSDRGLGQRPRQVPYFFFSSPAQSALLAVESGCVHQPE